MSVDLYPEFFNDVFGPVMPVGPFKPDFAARWAIHAASPRRLTDDLTAAVLTWA